MPSYLHDRKNPCIQGIGAVSGAGTGFCDGGEAASLEADRCSLPGADRHPEGPATLLRRRNASARPSRVSRPSRPPGSGALLAVNHAGRRFCDVPHHRVPAPRPRRGRFAAPRCGRRTLCLRSIRLAPRGLAHAVLRGLRRHQRADKFLHVQITDLRPRAMHLVAQGGVSS